MYDIKLNDSDTIEVKTRKHNYFYSTNGSLPNPLEATYAALTGCAAVYLKKAATKMQKSVVGIEIKCRSLIQPQNPMIPTKWMTQINFTPDWSESERTQAIEMVGQCAVKELISKGYDIEFEITSSVDFKSNDLII